MERQKIKIGIVDDHAFFRQGLHMMLARKEDFEVVLEAENGKDLFEKIGDPIPDLILMDIKMPEMDGVQATKEMVKEFPGVYVIALTMFKEKDYVEDMLKAGAKGFLFKNADEVVIEEAVKKVFREGYYFSENVIQVL